MAGAAVVTLVILALALAALSVRIVREYERLAEAAALLGREKDAITLRTLRMLAEVATEQNSTLIFPVPADLISVLRWGSPAGSD